MSAAINKFGRFATEKEVLKEFRILTGKEAFLRRAIASIITGLLISVAAYFLPLLTTLLYLSFTLFAAVTLSDFILSVIPKKKSSIEEYLFDSNFSDSNTEDPMGTIYKSKTNSNLYGRFILKATIFCGFIGLFWVAYPYVSRPGLFLVFFVFISFSTYYFFDTLIKMANSSEIPDFPTKQWHKFLRRIHNCFASNRGAYLIGAVNGKLFGLPRYLRFLHTLIIGPTGELKTTSFIIPQLLLDAFSFGSAVDIDAKSPSHYNAVAGRWIKEDKRVFLFDPWHPDTIAIEPLSTADDEDLLIIVEVLMQEREDVMKPDPFFRSRTKCILFSVLKLVQSFKAEYCNLASAYHLCQSVDVLDAFIKASSPEIQSLFSDYMTKMSNETKMNALTSIRDKLDIFMDSDVRKAFSRPDFSLSKLFEHDNPCLFIIGTPVDKEAQGLKIASLLANLISNLAFKERRLQKLAQQRRERSFDAPDLYMYLDELRKLKIIRLPDLISIARETRMHIIGSVTDLGFFKYYGQDFASLMGCFRTQIVLGGLDADSAAYFSRSLGQKTEPDYRFMGDKTITGRVKVDLMDISEVKGIPKKKFLVIPPITEVRPFPAEKININTSDWVKKLQEPLPSNIRELYQSWGISTEPLQDRMLPKLQDEYFDFAAIIDRNKKVSVNPAVLDKFFSEQGGGKFVQNEQFDDDVLFKRGRNDADGDFLMSAFVVDPP